jgi:hypothetical protein
MRKSDGKEGTASRGSGALPAFVDIIMEMRRFNPDGGEDGRRTLTGLARYRETPAELVVELTDEEYVVHGSRDETAGAELIPVILDLLPNEPPGWTTEAIAKELKGTRKKVLLAALRAGTARGDWHQIGEGKAGDPFMYYRS